MEFDEFFDEHFDEHLNEDFDKNFDENSDEVFAKLSPIPIQSQLGLR